MFQGFFELKTAQDLLDKLKREYMQLQKSPLNQDIAFNFFITAEHMPDWIYPDVENVENKNKDKKTQGNK